METRDWKAPEIYPDYPGVVTVTVLLDTEVDQYRRKVLNFLEIIGIVGGIFEFLETTAGYIVGTISFYSIRKEIVKNLDEANKNKEQLVLALNSIKPSPSHPRNIPPPPHGQNLSRRK